jgi:hypothetical protein
VLFFSLTKTNSRPALPVILYSISNSLNSVNRVSSESEQKKSQAKPQRRKGKRDFERELAEVTEYKEMAFLRT